MRPAWLLLYPVRILPSVARIHGRLFGIRSESHPGGRADQVQVASTLTNGAVKALAFTGHSRSGCDKISEGSAWA